MSMIRETVTRALPREAQGGQYSRYVDSVVSALEEQAARSADVIRHAARRAGVGSAQVEEVLINAGLVERPTPPPAPAARATGAVEEQFARLVEFARSHGFRG